MHDSELCSTELETIKQLMGPKHKITVLLNATPSMNGTEHQGILDPLLWKRKAIQRGRRRHTHLRFRQLQTGELIESIRFHRLLYIGH